jgi:hypothetical protein
VLKGRPYLEQFQRTTERAAAITRQLRAFSRKQVLDAKPVDLHEVLTESEFMLARLLGSDITLTLSTTQRVPGCWPILRSSTRSSRISPSMSATPCHAAEASRFPPATPTNFPPTFPHWFAAELLHKTGSSGKGTALGSTV